jgi:hypothetical protein
MVRYIHDFLIVIVCFFQFNINAENEKDRCGFGFQPIIGYDDDASWTIGGNSAFYYNPHPEDSLQELDQLDLTTTYSFNGGANVNADITKNLHGNNRVLNVVLGCEKYVDYFYGTGENTKQEATEKYTAIDAPFKVSYSMCVMEHFYVSAVYDFLYHDMSGEGADDALLSDELRESDKTHCSGIGIGLTYRTTNPGLYKRKGYQISLNQCCYLPALFSTSLFQCASLNYRYYTPLLSKCVLGFQIRADMTHGDVPVNYLSCLGGNKLIRGFKNSRYMARNSIAGQAEFRFPLWWRLGGTAFFGAGEVADKFKYFDRRIKAAAGIGLRLAVQKKQNINIRFDLAFNSDGEIMKYIKLKEAF